MRTPEKLDWISNAHLENIMSVFCQTCESFWQTGRADVSAEWWPRSSGDNRRAVFLFSSGFQLLLLRCGLTGAGGCSAGTNFQEQSQCSAVNIGYQSPAPSLSWILLISRCRGWNQIQHLHYWSVFEFMAPKPGKMREAKPASSFLHELELFQVLVLYLNTLVFQGWSFVGSPTNRWTSWSSSGFTEHHWGKQIILALCTLGQIFLPSALILLLPHKKDLAHFHSFVLIHQLRKCLILISHYLMIYMCLHNVSVINYIKPYISAIDFVYYGTAKLGKHQHTVSRNTFAREPQHFWPVWSWPIYGLHAFEDQDWIFVVFF